MHISSGHAPLDHGEEHDSDAEHSGYGGTVSDFSVFVEVCVDVDREILRGVNGAAAVAGEGIETAEGLEGLYDADYGKEKYDGR